MNKETPPSKAEEWLKERNLTNPSIQHYTNYDMDVRLSDLLDEYAGKKALYKEVADARKEIADGDTLTMEEAFSEEPQSEEQIEAIRKFFAWVEEDYNVDLYQSCAEVARMINTKSPLTEEEATQLQKEHESTIHKHFTTFGKWLAKKGHAIVKL